MRNPSAPTNSAPNASACHDGSSFRGRLFAAQPGLQLLAVAGAGARRTRRCWRWRAAAAGRRPRCPAAARSRSRTAGRRRAGTRATPSRCAAAEDHRGQDGDEQQPGHSVDQHVDARSRGSGGAVVRHGPSLPTARIFRSRRFFVAYLLLILVLAGSGLRRLAADACHGQPTEDADDRPGRRPGFPAAARPRGQSPRLAAARPRTGRWAASRPGTRRRPPPPVRSAPRGSPGCSRSRLISAPSSRCGSNGTSRTARQRREKWSTTFCMSTLPDRGRTALITATELRTRSWWPWASSQSSVADALRAPSTEPELIDDQHVGLGQHRRHRRVQQPGAAVGEHQAVEPLEHLQRAGVVVGAERLRHRRVALRGQHLQPAGALRRVAADVAVALDALGVAQQVAHRRRGLQRHLLAQRAAVGVGVDGDHPVAADRGERRARASR